MSGLKVGDEFPAVKFKYIPYTEENSDIVACGIPQELDAHTVLPPFSAPSIVVVLCCGIVDVW